MQEAQKLIPTDPSMKGLFILNARSRHVTNLPTCQHLQCDTPFQNDVAFLIVCWARISCLAMLCLPSTLLLFENSAVGIDRHFWAWHNRATTGMTKRLRKHFYFKVKSSSSALCDANINRERQRDHPHYSSFCSRDPLHCGRVLVALFPTPGKQTKYFSRTKVPKKQSVVIPW
jgi:hypothetical protein